MYILREMETFTNSDQIAIQTYKHDTGDMQKDLRLAESQLHQIMASALINDEVKMVVCDIIAPSGMCARYESDVKPDAPTIIQEPEN